MRIHHLPPHATSNDHAVLIAVLGACATVLVAIIGGLWAYLEAKREQRRLLYSQAVKAAVAWREFLYRVRRRDVAQSRDLINRFHEFQDEIAYYQAWIGSESEPMQRSYDRFVDGIKQRTEALITTAWAEEIREVPGNARPGDEHPDLSDLTDSFLTDVREHLSPWPWIRSRVTGRNQKES